METKQMSFNLLNFEKWLSDELKEQRMTVSKLSRLSGVHHNTIRNYLAYRCAPTLCNILCIANALGYDVVVTKK